MRTGARLTPLADRPDAVWTYDFIHDAAANALRWWLGQAGILTAYIDPGKPWQNGVGESFHSRFRDECLDHEWFHTPQEARVLIEQYRRQYNEARPHSSLGYHTPAEVGARRAPIASGSPSEHGQEALLAVT